MFGGRQDYMLEGRLGCILAAGWVAGAWRLVGLHARGLAELHNREQAGLHVRGLAELHVRGQAGLHARGQGLGCMLGAGWVAVHAGLLGCMLGGWLSCILGDR
jgi:hypothetical protein